MYQCYENDFQTLRLMRLRERYYNTQLLQGIETEDVQSLEEFKTFLQQDPLDSYEIFSKLAEKYNEAQISVMVNKNDALRKLTLQNTMLILKDFNEQKQKYQDDKKLANFLRFTNRLILVSIKGLLQGQYYLEEFLKQPQFQAYARFLFDLLKTTKSLSVMRAVLNYCLQSQLSLFEEQHEPLRVKLLELLSGEYNKQVITESNIQDIIDMHLYLPENFFLKLLQILGQQSEHIQNRRVIERYFKLISQLISHPKQRVPKKILQGLFGIFKNRTFDKRTSFKNLDSVSNNPQMKILFEETFPQTDPPNIQLLGQILVYDFAKLPYLQKLHEKALKEFKPEYSQFLNKVISIYSEEEFEKLRPFFEEHIEKYIEAFITLSKSVRRIQEQPISRLKISNASILEVKIKLFRNQHEVQLKDNEIVLKVHRTNVFEESFQQIMKLDSQTLKGKLVVIFIGLQNQQQFLDSGGPLQQWFRLISQALADPKYRLFNPTKGQLHQHYTPHPFSGEDEKALKMYVFVGKIVGLALRHKQTINLFFTPSLYKYLLNVPVNMNDLEKQDFQLYKNIVRLQSLQSLQIQNLALDFTDSVKKEEKNQIIQIQLVKGGRDKSVTNKNILYFQNRLSNFRLTGRKYSQIRNIILGFNELVPLQSLNNFNVVEFMQLLSGKYQCTANDIKMKVVYEGYTENDKIIQWLWEILEKISQDQLLKFVLFITGTRCFGGKFQKRQITIQKIPDSQKMMQAYSDSYLLELPQYSSKEQLEKKIKLVISFMDIRCE